MSIKHITEQNKKQESAHRNFGNETQSRVGSLVHKVKKELEILLA